MSKMYCIVARESLIKMNGNRGKLAAQAGHAYLHAYWDAMTVPSDGSDYAHRMEPAFEYKRSGAAKKVCLVVDTVEELKALYEAYRPICGVSLVTDAGLTCFKEPTTTCLGIGPIADDQVNVNLSSLKVLL
jgi:peptidyl-tRNA hydrolase